MRYLVLSVLALVALPELGVAQDAFGSRLDWGTVVVNIYPDAFTGMHLSAGTIEHTRAMKHHGISGGFEPESVFAWLNIAERVLAPIAPPSGPDVILVTPALRSLAGDSVRLLRRPKGNGWDRRIAVLIDRPAPDSEHFDIMARAGEIRALFTALQREAGLSGYVRDSAASAMATAQEEWVRATEAPTLVRAGRAIYPDRSLRGMVTLTFVIDSTGLVDRTTIRAIYGDHLKLIDWAKQMVGESRFTPACFRGQPVRITVQQSVHYSP